MLTNWVPGAQLLTVSALAVPTLVVTAYLHHVRALRPLYSAYANGALAVLWALGLALLSWNIATLLGARCDTNHWDHATGVSVCRLFKTLESFAVVGTYVLHPHHLRQRHKLTDPSSAATAAACALDVYTHRASVRLGAYNPMGGDAPPRRRDVKRPPSPPTRGGGRDPSRDGRAGALEMPAEAHEPLQPYRAGPRPLGAQSFAYEAPSEQTRYDGPGAKWD